MFGKTKDTSEVDDRVTADVSIDDFFGDESAVAEAVRVDHLHQRVTQVELQISSQFTSLAAYAQIAQEQVELVRSEAQNANERSEQRVIGLIERERSDRLESAFDGPTGVAARLDSLDAQVAEIREGLQQCLSNQKALADAITDLFAPAVDAPPPPGPMVGAPAAESVASSEPAPAMPMPLTAVPSSPAPVDAPPPPVALSPVSDLDADLQELGVDFLIDSDLEDLDDLGLGVMIEPMVGIAEDVDFDAAVAAFGDLDAFVALDDDDFTDVEAAETADESHEALDGPIDGLSLA